MMRDLAYTGFFYVFRIVLFVSFVRTRIRDRIGVIQYHFSGDTAMQAIIDAHTHLGDILNHGGGSLIEKKGVKKARIFDPISVSEALLHRDFGGGDALFKLLLKWVVRAERARNAVATRENCRTSMDEAGVSHTVCLPVPPYVTFDDLRQAHLKDTGIIPFTGIDYTRQYDVQAELSAHVAQGAKGMKLHPVIQRMPLNSPQTFAGVEAFAPHGLPVLFHCGFSSYYQDGEKDREVPEYGGEIRHAQELMNSSRPFPA
jgi:uncharacterized protein